MSFDSFLIGYLNIMSLCSLAGCFVPIFSYCLLYLVEMFPCHWLPACKSLLIGWLLGPHVFFSLVSCKLPCLFCLPIGLYLLFSYMSLVENKKLFNNNITGRCSCVRVLQGQQGRADDILLQGTVF